MGPVGVPGHSPVRHKVGNEPQGPREEASCPQRPQELPASPFPGPQNPLHCPAGPPWGGGSASPSTFLASKSWVSGCRVVGKQLIKVINAAIKAGKQRPGCRCRPPSTCCCFPPSSSTPSGLVDATQPDLGNLGGGHSLGPAPHPRSCSHSRTPCPTTNAGRAREKEAEAEAELGTL